MSYTAPTAADLKARFPAFSRVSDDRRHVGAG
jgi:hypothetical protein